MIMAISDVAAVGRTLLQLVNTVQGLGNNFYKSSAAWDEFPTQVALLQARHLALEGSLEKYGLLDELGPVLELLKGARELLQEEEDRLQRRNNRATQTTFTTKFKTCCGRVGEIFFPEKVGIAIRIAIGAYDSIEAYFKSKQAYDQFAKEEVKNDLRTLSFRNLGEEFYVPLGCEEMVCSALKESGIEFPAVVLLYGGAGTGKTTVVRHICLLFQEDKSMFNQVVFLECGKSVDVQDKEILLLQKLQVGWDEVLDLSQDSNQDVITQKLQKILKRRKLLVVLDDLWEPALLLRLLNLSGPQVKFLVSSQRKDICETLGCQSKIFNSDNIEDSVAKQILAVHAGFPNRCIPDSLQHEDIVLQTFEQAGRIPLVLATIGAQIGSLGKDEVETLENWTCISKQFVRRLHSDPPSKSIFGHTYAKTYWSAVRQHVDGLSLGEKHLFLLLCTCTGSSVLQHILQFFLTITIPDCDRVSFLQWKEKLKSKNLVFEKDKMLLSVHSVTKKLVQEYLQEDQVSAVHSLVEKGLSILPCCSESVGQNTSLIITLVSLYLGQSFGEALASKAGLKSVLLSDARRRTVEPITELLVLQIASQRSWAGELHQPARQVFLQFVYEDMFDHNHIARLLDSQEGIPAVLKFLENSSFLEQAYWEKNSVGSISQRLFGIFENTSHPDCQALASTTLTQLCYCDGGLRTDILKSLGVFQRLISYSCDDQNPQFQVIAARLLTGALYTPIIHTDVLDNSTLSEWLLQSLSQNQNVLFQIYAAIVIANFACSKKPKTRKLLDIPGLLSSLVRCGRQVENLELAAEVARAIRNLAGTENSIMRGEICSFPNLLDFLAEALVPGKDVHPFLQNSAVVAVVNLGFDPDENRKRIFNTPGLLSSLMRCGRQEENSNLAANAVSAIHNLTATEESTMKEKICSFPNLLDFLVEALQPNKDMNGPLQVEALGCVANLGSGPEANRKSMVNTPGLLSSLVRCGRQGENMKLAAQAGRAIRHFANPQESTMIDKICSFPNLLDFLAEALVPDKHMNGPLQVQALAIVANLACGSEANRKSMVNTPALLSSLVRCGRQVENLELAVEAGRGIQNLTVTQELTLKREICSFPNLLDFLAEALLPEKHINGPLQVSAIEAVANLVGDFEENIEMMANFPGLFSSLLRCRQQSKNLELALEAARAIRNVEYAFNNLPLEKLSKIFLTQASLMSNS